MASLYKFLNFSLVVDQNNKYTITEPFNLKLPSVQVNDEELVDSLYLPVMLKFYETSTGYTRLTKELQEDENNEESPNLQFHDIQDAFPVLANIKDVNSPFYDLSIHRLRKYAEGLIPQDDITNMLIRHLFLYCQLIRESVHAIWPRDPAHDMIEYRNMLILLEDCMQITNPIQFDIDSLPKNLNCGHQDFVDNCSTVPTHIYCRMVLVPAWIDKAMHYKNHTIVFFAKDLYADDDSTSCTSLQNKEINAKFFIFENTFDERYAFITNAEVLKPVDRSLKSILGEVYWAESRVKNLIELKTFLFDREEDIDHLGRPTETTLVPQNIIKRFHSWTLKTKLFTQLTTMFNANELHLTSVFYFFQNSGCFDGRIFKVSKQISRTKIQMYMVLLYNNTTRKFPPTKLVVTNPATKLTRTVKLKQDCVYVIPMWFNFRLMGGSLRHFVLTRLSIGVLPHELDQPLCDITSLMKTEVDMYMSLGLHRKDYQQVLAQSFTGICQLDVYQLIYLNNPNAHTKIPMSFISAEFEVAYRSGRVRPIDEFTYMATPTHLYIRFGENISKSMSRNSKVIICSLVYLDDNNKAYLVKSDRYMSSKPNRITSIPVQFDREYFDGYSNEQQLENDFNIGAIHNVLVELDHCRHDETITVINNLTFGYAPCEDQISESAKDHYITCIFPKQQKKNKKQTAQKIRRAELEYLTNDEIDSIMPPIEFLGPAKEFVKVPRYFYRYNPNIDITRSWCSLLNI